MFLMFVKVASAATTTAAVAGGLYAVLSSSAFANYKFEVPFGAQREGREGDYGGLWSRRHETPSQVNNEGATTKSEIGWVKLNVAGSHDPNKSFFAGCGGVLWDTSRKWLRGFAQKLDPDTYNKQDKTELQAILRGLKMARERKDIKKLVVELDSESVVKMVNNKIKCKENGVVIEEILKLFHVDDWEVKLVLISNEANCVANRLANDASTLSSYDPCKYYVPPANEEFLKNNRLGV